MVGVYFSGTGNTKYCLNRFLNEVSESSEIYSIENENINDIIKKNDDIIFAYSICYSNLFKIVRDFIVSNQSIWKDKNIFIICTMGLFSGDGAGLSARLFKKYGANIIGGLHLRMPDIVADVGALKKTYDENMHIIEKTNGKIISAAKNFKMGKAPKEGLGIFYHLAGLFGQRLWFYSKTKHYSDKIKIDNEKCIKCRLCINNCPMNNLSIEDGKVVQKSKCTMCYRCINNCPKEAITLLGRNVIKTNYITMYKI